MSKNKIACVYAYYEKNELYKENFQYFIEHGMLLETVDYYVAVNGECTVCLPLTKPNLTVIHRENKGFDFGAYGDVLTSASRDFSGYDFVFFLNTSVRGPFLPEGKESDWTESFIDIFKEDPSVKLVGTSINVLDSRIPFLLPGDAKKPLHPHVQSMFFVLDREALDFLRREGFFALAKEGTMSFLQAIARFEVGMSFLILENGWNISCLLPGYRGLDYRSIASQPNPSSKHGDPYFKNAYFGKTILPTDVIFYKNNRKCLSNAKLQWF